MAAQPLMNTYARMSVAFARGEGAWLYDTEGNRFLDALSGIAVCGLGHAHPAVTAAIAHQAGQLVHTSNLYRVPLQEQLGERLAQLSGMDKVFFANSGAEANEAAIKIARLHGHAQGQERPGIVVMEQGFHGRTLATLSATANRKAQAGFEPLVDGFVRAPFNDLAAVESIAAHHPEIAAVLVEPIQGEGGIQVPDPAYLPGLKALCERHGWLLMLDEIQTGNGRTGSFFAYQQQGLVPDVVTTAKGLGNGVPIGACLARGPAAELMQPGSHGSTFGGNPLACAAAMAVLDTLESEQLSGRAAELGDWMLNALRTELADCSAVKEVRGAGLMIGVECREPISELAVLAKVKGILVNVTAGGRVLRLLPPLILKETEANLIVGVISKLIKIVAGDDETP